MNVNRCDYFFYFYYIILSFVRVLSKSIPRQEDCFAVILTLNQDHLVLILDFRSQSNVYWDEWFLSFIIITFIDSFLGHHFVWDLVDHFRGFMLDSLILLQSVHPCLFLIHYHYLLYCLLYSLSVSMSADTPFSHTFCCYAVSLFSTWIPPTSLGICVLISCIIIIPRDSLLLCSIVYSTKHKTTAVDYITPLFMNEWTQLMRLRIWKTVN